MNVIIMLISLVLGIAAISGLWFYDRGIAVLCIPLTVSALTVLALTSRSSLKSKRWWPK